MINGEKVGVGIVTYNRPHLLAKCVLSLYDNEKDIDAKVIVNDGNPINPNGVWHYIQNETNLGVGKSKNKAFRFLLESGCDHIFLFEDDIFVKDQTVFEKYIQASKDSGIQHFNFSQHGVMNKTFDGFGQPNPRYTVNYKNSSISFYPHCVGAMSYYSKRCLEEVGLFDERYWNACEHVDHTYEIIKAGFHPQFWHFADIANSWEYLGDEEWSIQKSTISSSPNHQQMMKDADRIFIEKHGHLPVQTPQASTEEFFKKLKELKP